VPCLFSPIMQTEEEKDATKCFHLHFDSEGGGEGGKKKKKRGLCLSFRHAAGWMGRA